MILFKDKNTDSEMFTDSFKVIPVQDVFYEVEGEHTTVSHNTKIDIGANASAEEAPQQAEDFGSSSGVDIVMRHELKKIEIPYSIKEYKMYLKEYLKTLEFPEGKADEYKLQITNYFKEAFGKKGEKFESFDQYFGSENDVDRKPMLILLNFRKETDAPYAVFFKHGLIEEKC